MADFCRACTAELFGPQYADKNDMIRTDLQEGYVAAGLCEHCGPGWFDRDGNRIESDNEQ